jgi:2-hydroxy-6-oxonona-2,4-dienedioate hydrolase
LRDSWWRIGGWAVHGWEAGDGPPLVLVHGLGVSGRYLLPAARALAGRFRVVVPDLPGSGLSTRPPRPLRLHELSEVLDRLADAIGFGQATFLANSYGCQVVTNLAAAHADRVERLVLVGPTVDDSARDPVRQVARLLLDGLHEPRRLIAIVASDYARAGPVTIATGAAEALRHRIEVDARRVSVPAIVVRGSRDPLVPQAWAERLAKAFPAGELHVVAGAPHAAHFTHPDALASIVSAGTRSMRG